jgi:hypothetical protein
MKFNVEVTANVECTAYLLVEAETDEQAEAIALGSPADLRWETFGSYPDVMHVTVEEEE